LQPIRSTRVLAGTTVSTEASSAGRARRLTAVRMRAGRPGASAVKEA